MNEGTLMNLVGEGRFELPILCARIGKTPDRSRPELLVLRLEVKVMDRPGKMFRSFQPALHKRLVDDHLGRYVRQFTSLPGFHLLSHRLEVSLHSINTNRNAIDERERL